jgi:serine/threonine protein kinase
MWNLGAVTFAMLCGFPPFLLISDDPFFVIQKILDLEFYECAGDRTRPFDKVSEDAQSFVKALMVVEPDDRLTAEQAFNRPFVHRLEKG